MATEPIRVQARLEKGCRVVSPLLPNVGETIMVEPLGHAIVEEIFHTTHDNFIKLELQETLVGKFRQDFPFEVKP